MSGIAGIIRFDGMPVEPGQVEAMTAAIAHRGPDTREQLERDVLDLADKLLEQKLIGL